MKESPLFWPIKLKGKTIYVLDETQLPQKLVYLQCKNISQVVRAIKDMKTRAFGQVLIVWYTFLMALEKNKKTKPELLLKILKKAAGRLEGARPTFPFRDFTVSILHYAQKALNNKEDIKAALSNRINADISMIRKARYNRAEKAARLIKNNDCILTHCNVSGELPLIAQICKNKNKKIKFFVTETRPYFQGSRLTAWELNYTGFDVTIIVDDAVAKVMQEGKIDKVIVGADCLAQNGDIVNKIGTYNIAILAKKFKIPFYVLAPPASNYKKGSDIPIEIRPQKELLEYKGMRIAPLGIKGYYPAFDITPRKLITKHISLM
ncbi:MAG: S-methyl-5-thioribose-1-phosphate isomerase [Candidatus Omnitrophica bacterium]|nr:S-methyl-5-thioribose-1-phosphate isomerase [Candidatus Omnitrophota bacterium]